MVYLPNNFDVINVITYQLTSTNRKIVNENYVVIRLVLSENAIKIRRLPNCKYLFARSTFDNDTILCR